MFNKIQTEGHYYWNALKSLADSQDPDKAALAGFADERKGVKDADRAALEGLFERYLKAPCEHYLKEIQPEVMALIRFDIELRFKYSNQPASALHAAEAKFTYCSRLVNDSNAMDALVSSTKSS